MTGFTEYLAETAIGLLRLAEQMPEASVRPNPGSGPNARALQLDFDNDGAAE